jgi:methylmalonyl-CoA carboxyltransferase large subunit
MARITIADLQAQIAELTRRLEALEPKVQALEPKPVPAAASPAAAAPVAAAPVPAAPAPEPVPEAIGEEELLAISAAVAAFLGVRAHIRQIRLLSSTAWAQQGRVSIMASHRL